jgi:hypothetical protein
VLGRGLVWCDSGTALRWIEGKAPENAHNHHALVHRNHLALMPERTSL